MRSGSDGRGLSAKAVIASFVTAALATAAIGATAAVGQSPGPEPEPERPPEFQGHGAESKNMRLVGHSDLQGRSAYQPVTKFNAQNDQWYTYVGLHGGEAFNPLTNRIEDNGTLIVRVTNPRRPRVVEHIPPTDPPGVEDQSGAQMVRICDGEDLAKGDDDKVYMLRSNGDVSHEIWDVTQPRRPELVTTIVGAPVSEPLVDTHKNYWDCESGLGWLIGGTEDDLNDRALMLYDLSNPEDPKHIRNYGQGGPLGTEGQDQYAIHGGIQIGDRYYQGWGTSRNGLYEIFDVSEFVEGNVQESLITQRFLPRYYGAHTTFPVLDIPVKDDEDFFWDTRDILVISNESTSNECREAHQQAFFVDITDEQNPLGISNYKVDESEGDFCERGGRFGAHSSNENLTDEYYKKIVFFAYFNAGIRGVDIRDPFNPKEVAKYIPATTENTVERCVDLNDDDVDDRCKTAIQTNNLDTDDREYVYAVDRANTGLHIVTVTGKARRIMRSNVEPNEPDDSPTLEELAGN